MSEALKRTFIAVNIPAETKEKIFKTLSSELPEKGCKKVERENLHITMVFLGYLDEKKINEIENAMEKISVEKFEAELKGVNHFNGRVIWLGVTEGSLELSELSRQLGELTGIKEDKFHAHLTLARNKSLGRAEVKKIVDEMNAKGFSEKISVESADLMESILSGKGPKYVKLFAKKLA